MKRLLLLSLVACGHHEDPPPGRIIWDPRGSLPQFPVTSSAFVAGGEIPIEHTCEGADVPPPLAWRADWARTSTGAPVGTKTYALIVDDPDAPDPSAPKHTWVHWVVAGIPLSTDIHGDGVMVGNNDFGKTAWGGPCPPIGRHRYFFKVYALDAVIGHPGITKDELLHAMAGHVLAKGELVGTYQKKQP